MKKQFKYLDGIITVETTNGRTAVTLTDTDGETSTLEEVGGTAATLTEEQIARINTRFGDPLPNGQPY